MAETKHLAGPWEPIKVDYGPSAADGYKEYIDIRASDTLIATVKHTGMEWEEYEANAALIAAAPDLLAACKELARITALVQQRQQCDLGEACGSCGGYHFNAFDGDCRDDSERFPSYDPYEEASEKADAAIAKATP